MGCSKRLRILVDTNVILHALKEGIDLFDIILQSFAINVRCYILTHVLKELINLCVKFPNSLTSRLIERFLIHRLEKFEIFHEDVNQNMNVDDVIIHVAKVYNMLIVTNDRRLRRKALSLNLPVGVLNINKRRIVLCNVEIW